MDIENLTDVRNMEYTAYRINVVRHQYWNDPNFEEKPLFRKFCKKNVDNQDTVFPTARKEIRKTNRKI